VRDSTRAMSPPPGRTRSKRKPPALWQVTSAHKPGTPLASSFEAHSALHLHHPWAQHANEGHGLGHEARALPVQVSKTEAAVVKAKMFLACSRAGLNTPHAPTNASEMLGEKAENVVRFGLKQVFL